MTTHYSHKHATQCLNATDIVSGSGVEPLGARSVRGRRDGPAGTGSPSATGPDRISPSGETGRLPPASALLGPSAVPTTPTTPAPPGGGRRR